MKLQRGFHSYYWTLKVSERHPKKPWKILKTPKDHKKLWKKLKDMEKLWKIFCQRTNYHFIQDDQKFHIAFWDSYMLWWSNSTLPGVFMKQNQMSEPSGHTNNNYIMLVGPFSCLHQPQNIPYGPSWDVYIVYQHQKTLSKLWTTALMIMTPVSLFGSFDFLDFRSW